MACKKDGHGPAAAGARIKSITSDGGSQTYTYDSRGRASKIIVSSYGKIEYTYTDTGIVLKSYDEHDSLWAVGFYKLDAHGRAISYTESDEPYNKFFFSYNADGQQSTFIIVDNTPGRPKDSAAFNYYYANRNLDSMVRVDKNGSVVTRTVEYYDEYYTDKINTTGNENTGAAWLGSSSRNPLKTARDLGKDANGHYPQSTFAYEYDAQGRITREVRSRPGYPDAVINYIYY